MSGNINIYSQPDPLLSPEYMDAHIAKMQEIRDEVVARQQQQQQQQAQVQAQQQPKQKTVLDDINEELNSLSESQKKALFGDKDYAKLDEAIAAVAMQYQVQLLMPYVMNDEQGKKLLEKQLLVIRTKKDDIVAAEQAEMEEFRRWKENKSKGE